MEKVSRRASALGLAFVEGSGRAEFIEVVVVVHEIQRSPRGTVARLHAFQAQPSQDCLARRQLVCGYRECNVCVRALGRLDAPHEDKRDSGHAGQHLGRTAMFCGRQHDLGPEQFFEEARGSLRVARHERDVMESGFHAYCRWGWLLRVYISVAVELRSASVGQTRVRHAVLHLDPHLRCSQRSNPWPKARDVGERGRVVGRDLGGGQDAVVERRVGVRDQRDRIAQTQRPACCRVHAEVALQSADDEPLDAVALQEAMQFRLVKGVRGGLSDQDVGRFNAQPVRQLPGIGPVVHGAAHGFMLNHHDQGAGSACLGADYVDSFDHAPTLKGRVLAKTQAVLDIDDEEGCMHGLCDQGWRCWASSDGHFRAQSANRRYMLSIDSGPYATTPTGTL